MLEKSSFFSKVVNSLDFGGLYRAPNGLASGGSSAWLSWTKVSTVRTDSQKSSFFSKVVNSLDFGHVPQAG